MANAPTRPFKKLFCDRRETLRLNGNDLKVWLSHYLHENEKRESWVSRDTIAKETGLSRATVTRCRKWLEENGWLKQVGIRYKDDGGKVPVFSVTRGTIPQGGSSLTPPRSAQNERVGSNPASGRLKSEGGSPQIERGVVSAVSPKVDIEVERTEEEKEVEGGTESFSGLTVQPDLPDWAQGVTRWGRQ